MQVLGTRKVLGSQTLVPANYKLISYVYILEVNMLYKGEGQEHENVWVWLHVYHMA